MIRTKHFSLAVVLVLALLLTWGLFVFAQEDIGGSHTQKAGVSIFAEPQDFYYVEKAHGDDGQMRRAMFIEKLRKMLRISTVEQTEVTNQIPTTQVLNN